MMPGNNALNSNPPNADIDIDSHGSDWLWAVFTVVALSDLIMIAWTHTRVRGQRILHNLAIAILTTTLIAYFAMASDLGDAPVMTEFGLRATRAIWYARHIEWIITTPMLLILVFLGSGLPFSDIFLVAFMGAVMFVNLLIGALVTSSYKWGFYAFSVAAFFYISYHLLVAGPRLARTLSGPHLSAFRSGSYVVVLTLFLYEIAWGISEGGNKIGADGEMVFYGILDLISKPVLLFLMVARFNSIESNTRGFGGGRPGAEPKTAVV